MNLKNLLNEKSLKIYPRLKEVYKALRVEGYLGEQVTNLAKTDGCKKVYDNYLATLPSYSTPEPLDTFTLNLAYSEVEDEEYEMYEKAIKDGVFDFADTSTSYELNKKIIKLLDEHYSIPAIMQSLKSYCLEERNNEKFFNALDFLLQFYEPEMLITDVIYDIETLNKIEKQLDALGVTDYLEENYKQLDDEIEDNIKYYGEDVASDLAWVKVTEIKLNFFEELYDITTVGTKPFLVALEPNPTNPECITEALSKVLDISKIPALEGIHFDPKEKNEDDFEI